MTSPQAGSARRDEQRNTASHFRRVDLQASEVELLLRTCAKYRASLAPYLRVNQPELALIEQIVAKLKSTI